MLAEVSLSVLVVEMSCLILLIHYLLTEKEELSLRHWLREDVRELLLCRNPYRLNESFFHAFHDVMVLHVDVLPTIFIVSFFR